MRKRHFTLRQANSLLSRVRPRVERMMQLSVHLRGGGEASETPKIQGMPWLASSVFTAWDGEIPEHESGLSACLYETLSDELKKLETLGAEVKDLSIGLTVFPSYLDGQREVLLAWTIRDGEIRTYYPPKGGYRHRKPVDGLEFTAVRAPTGQLRE